MSAKRFAAMVGMLVVLASACGKSEPLSSGPATGFHVSESVYFSNIDELVATADVVAIATVKRVSSGQKRAAGTPDEIRHTNTELSFDEVLKGSPSRGNIVETLELAYSSPHVEWRKSGERIVAFLTNSTEGRQLYIPTNHSQSVYLLRGDDVRSTVEDELSELIASWSLPEVRQRVGESRERAARGETTPKPRGPRPS